MANVLIMDFPVCHVFDLYVYRWFTKWQKYVGEETGAYQLEELSNDKQASASSKVGERPGPIDNTDIIANEGGHDGNDLQLPRTLVEREDYVLVPQGVWDKLHGWYMLDFVLKNLCIFNLILVFIF